MKKLPPYQITYREDIIEILRVDNQGNKIGEIFGEKQKSLFYYINFLSIDEYNKLIKGKKLFMIRMLEIEQEFRNQGHGTKFMLRMLLILKRKKIKHVLLNAHPVDFNGLKMPELKKFYEKFGFRILHEDYYCCYMLLDLC